MLTLEHSPQSLSYSQFLSFFHVRADYTNLSSIQIISLQVVPVIFRIIMNGLYIFSQIDINFPTWNCYLGQVFTRLKEDFVPSNRILSFNIMKGINFDSLTSTRERLTALDYLMTLLKVTLVLSCVIGSSPFSSPIPFELRLSDHILILNCHKLVILLEKAMVMNWGQLYEGTQLSQDQGVCTSLHLGTQWFISADWNQP